MNPVSVAAYSASHPRPGVGVRSAPAAASSEPSPSLRFSQYLDAQAPQESLATPLSGSPPHQLMATPGFFASSGSGGSGGSFSDDDTDDFDDDMRRVTTAMMRDRPHLFAKPWTGGTGGSDSMATGGGLGDAASRNSGGLGGGLASGGVVGEASKLSGSTWTAPDSSNSYAPLGQASSDQAFSSDQGAEGPGQGLESSSKVDFKGSGDPSVLGSGMGSGMGSAALDSAALDSAAALAATRSSAREAKEWQARQLEQVARVVATNPLMRHPPILPAVDAHIAREELTYASIKGALRAEQRGVLPKLPPKLPPKGHAGKARSAGGSKAGSRAGGSRSGSRGGSRAGSRVAEEETGFTAGEIRAVVQYMDETFNDGLSDGLIDAEEFERALRRAKRARAGEAFKHKAKLAVDKLTKLMAHHDLTPEEWFGSVDVSQTSSGHGDGRLGLEEVKRGLEDLTSGKAFRYMAFDMEEINNLTKFCDPDGDGSVSLEELKDALRRSRLTEGMHESEVKARAVLLKLEDHMAQRQMRARDLFASLDGDGSGRVSFLELQKALVEMHAPPPHQRAAIKKRRTLEAARAEERTVRAAQEAAMLKRLEHAKQSGAFEMLRRLDVFLQRQQLTVRALFNMVDASQDGLLDESEFTAALQALNFPMDRVHAPGMHRWPRGLVRE